MAWHLFTWGGAVIIVTAKELLVMMLDLIAIQVLARALGQHIGDLAPP